MPPSGRAYLELNSHTAHKVRRFAFRGQSFKRALLAFSRDALVTFICAFLSLLKFSVHRRQSPNNLVGSRWRV